MTYYYIVYRSRLGEGHPDSRPAANGFSVVNVSKADALLYKMKGLYVHLCEKPYNNIPGTILLSDFKLQEFYNVQFYLHIPFVNFDLL